MSEKKDDARELKAQVTPEVTAPDLPYRPPVPKSYRPKIGLVGCGGISKSHLEAYTKMGYEVVAFCDPRHETASAHRDTYFPKAEVFTDYREMYQRNDIDVVDLATHPDQRVALVREALRAGKHVLSQKPFVTDLAVGRELIDLADNKGLKLAVNQNGRWAPYFSYLRHAVKQGLLGDIVSLDIHIAWDHTWIRGTSFENIHHIILYDFAIHWFDMVACVFGERRAKQVFARAERAGGQALASPLNAHAVVQYDGGMASLVFRAATKFDPLESTVVTGAMGTCRSSGPVCANDRVTLTTEAGRAIIPLEGQWFPDGFAGTMGELLCAIEENREPENSARNNLKSLELCFAAVASADSGMPVIPGTVSALSHFPST